MPRGRTSGTRLAASLVLAAVMALALLTVPAGLAWIGRPFPGFFLLRNRVVASVSLPGWPAAMASDVFQQTVVAVDGVPVASSEAVYALVGARPAGTRFAYTIARDGAESIVGFESQAFTWRNALLIFGAYLFDGLVFAVIGVWVWVLSPRGGTTRALLGLCLALSTYALTAIDLYAPHRFFRLHALAECYLPATLVHLALLFPVRRMTPRRVALASYLPATVLALAYQLWLDDPARYPAVHAAATFGLVAGGVALLGAVLWGYVRAPSELVRHRVRFVAFGLLLGFVVPAVLFALSLVEQGRVPVNMTAFTAFVFPLSIAFAVHKRDLFEIDALVQRGFYYAILSGLVTAAYLAVAALATHVLHLSRLGQSAGFSLAFTLAVLLIMPRLRDRTQRLVDLIFGRRSYDAQDLLATASTALGATLGLDQILRCTLTIPATTLGLERVAVFLRREGVFEEAAALPGAAAGDPPACLAAERPLLRRLAAAPGALAREVIAAGSSPDEIAQRTDFDALRADLVVPLACQGRLTGFLVCGHAHGGTHFSAGDLSFLHTFANQAALSLQNARTYRDLKLLNADLERRVKERTQQLSQSTEQLSTSLEQLGAAYRTLQASQEQLVAAQKMAAFGRLTAGMAHEMNTPLGAALNGLKIAHDLTVECEVVVADAGASEADRRMAFGELRSMVASVEEWTRKAVAYIRSVKAHGRMTAGSAAPFGVARLLERDLAPLLMHRLRLVGGTLDLRLARDLPELFGDASRLGQVLANLLNNAIDACEGLPPDRTCIVIEVEREDDEIVLSIRDRGTGIPEDARERIFEAFYTTKPPGKGTGLGLSIARDIVAGEFGGSLACRESSPDGTTFTIRLPLRAPTEGSVLRRPAAFGAAA